MVRTSSSAGASGRQAPASRDESLSRSWRSGFIFFSRHDSIPENFERGVFGLPAHKRDLAQAIEPGTTALFLFDQTFRYLHGVYEATEAPGYDLDPAYLRGTGRAQVGSPFPVQVRFARVFDFKPLAEIKWCHMVTYK